MSAITPSTNVKLLKLPIELDNENQLTFASLTAQYNYFNSLPKLAVNDFTYQRKDGVIRFPGCIDELVGYNYVMYQNTAFGNKWFYAYIDKMTFVNPEMTDISIRTDAFQTWQFDIQYLDSFVEREHVNDDTPGLHTVPENLETGEPVVENVTTLLDVFSSTDHGGSSSDVVCMVVGVTELPADSTLTPPSGAPAVIRKYGAIFQGLYFYAFKNATDLQDFITMYTRAGKSESISCIFMCPISVIGLTSFAYAYTIQYSYQSQTYTVNNVYLVLESNGGYSNTKLGTETAYVHPKYTVVTVEPENRRYSLAGYNFRNNKLLTYPYSYINVTNNAGVDNIYKWEDFKLITNQTTGQAYPGGRFNVYAAMSTSPSTKLVPMDYKNRFGQGTNYEPSYEYGIVGQKFPACSWTSDYYTNWLTQNATNIKNSWTKSEISAISGLASSTINGARSGSESLLAAGVATGAIDAISGMASTLLNIQSAVTSAQIKADDLSGDPNAGDINYATGNSGFSIAVMAIKPEYSAIIDSYFDMFGYKVNAVKKPNITGRTNWNYVKTIRGKIHGYIPKEDLNTISGMLDNGVTFWHSPSTFLDYSQTNDII